MKFKVRYERSSDADINVQMLKIGRDTKFFFKATNLGIVFIIGFVGVLYLLFNIDVLTIGALRDFILSILGSK